MSSERYFTYSGYRVQLRLESGAAERYWVAEVADVDRLHVVAARPVDTIERVVPLVREWIDGGMLGGGLGA